MLFIVSSSNIGHRVILHQGTLDWHGANEECDMVVESDDSGRIGIFEFTAGMGTALLANDVIITGKIFHFRSNGIPKIVPAVNGKRIFALVSSSRLVYILHVCRSANHPIHFIAGWQILGTPKLYGGMPSLVRSTDHSMP